MTGFENTDSNAAAVLDEWSVLSTEERLAAAPFVSPGPVTRNRRRSCEDHGSAVKKTPTRASRKVSPTKEQASEPDVPQVARCACLVCPVGCRSRTTLSTSACPAGYLFPCYLASVPHSLMRARRCAPRLLPPGSAVGSTGHVTRECRGFPLHRRVAAARIRAGCGLCRHLEQQAQVSVRGCGASCGSRRCCRPRPCGRCFPQLDFSGASACRGGRRGEPERGGRWAKIRCGRSVGCADP